jgi:hypothetical protein
VQYSEPIERSFDTGGTLPSEVVDGYSGVVYDTWTLLAEWGFTKRVPQGFVAGSQIKIGLSESTPGISMRHKWQATVNLIQADAGTTDGAASETFTSEFVSPDTANRETNRIIAITDSSGRINGTNPAAGDILSVKLARVAASTNEDPNGINVLTYDLEAVVDQAAVSGCLGRVGKIMDRVFSLFNEVADEHLAAAEVLDWLDQCSAEVTQREYWRKTTALDAVADHGEYDLLTLIPNLERVYRVTWLGDTTAYQIPMLQTREDYDRIKLDNVASIQTTGNRKCFIDSNVLHIWPVPDASASAVIEVYHSEYPGDLGCTSDYTPKIPKGHDALYVYFALKEAFAKDAGSAKAGSMLGYYQNKFEMELQRLFGQQVDQDFSIMPG